MARPLALIVDDNPDDIELLSAVARPHYDIDSATSCAAGLERLSKRIPDIVLLDLHFPTGETGLDALRSIKAREPTLPVIMVTESTSTMDAVECIKAGAFHFVEKGELSATVLLSLMSKAVGQRRDHRAASSAREQVREVVGEIVGQSPAMTKVLREIEEVAPSDASVLIAGESGTGKELVARRIHEMSRRRDAPLVIVACPAIPSALLESEFFGTEKAAFTGAVPREGRFELADGGTVFLDEIADIEISLQPKLLRVLEEGTFERVGGRATIRVDVRIISATSRDLAAMVAEGSFRRELYYRLNTYIITVPPLRERPEDVPLLAERFVARYAKQLGKPMPTINDAALAKLRRYDWSRNNVRELRNCIEAAVIRCRGDELGERDFALPDGGVPPSPSGPGYREALAGFQRRYLERILELSGGNITKAAEQAGLSRRAIYEMIKRGGLDPGDFRGG